MTPTGASLPVASLPVVIVPLGTDEDALDACLAALDAGTPAGTRVWLADDAQAGPRATGCACGIEPVTSSAWRCCAGAATVAASAATAAMTMRFPIALQGSLQAVPAPFRSLYG